MKKVFKFMLLAAIATCFSSVFVACGDDDDDNGTGTGTGNTGGGTSIAVNPQNVFTGGIPASANGSQITTNADGLVTSITSEGGTKVTFEYVQSTKAAEAYDVIMTINYDESEKQICNLILGSNGFVSHCDEVEQYRDETENETWDFTYNSDGQLTQLVRSEGGKEKTVIKYEGGDITEVNTISEEYPDEASTYKIYYTSDKVTTAIENKGAIMLFDNTLGIDMDEMEYAYWAGLLGKATKHLPVRCVDTTEGYTDNFTWTLNAAGYPTKLSYESYPEESIVFTW